MCLGRRQSGEGSGVRSGAEKMNKNNYSGVKKMNKNNYSVFTVQKIRWYLMK